MPVPSDNMWVVSIYLHGRADVVKLTFGTRERALAAEQRAVALPNDMGIGPVHIEDDIGNMLTLSPSENHTVLLFDAQKVMAGEIAFAMMQQRFQQHLENERKGHDTAETMFSWASVFYMALGSVVAIAIISAAVMALGAAGAGLLHLAFPSAHADPIGEVMDTVGATRYVPYTTAGPHGEPSTYLCDAHRDPPCPLLEVVDVVEPGTCNHESGWCRALVGDGPESIWMNEKTGYSKVGVNQPPDMGPSFRTIPAQDYHFLSVTTVGSVSMIAGLTLDECDHAWRAAYGYAQKEDEPAIRAWAKYDRDLAMQGSERSTAATSRDIDPALIGPDVSWRTPTGDDAHNFTGQVELQRCTKPANDTNIPHWIKGAPAAVCTPVSKDEIEAARAKAEITAASTIPLDDWWLNRSVRGPDGHQRRYYSLPSSSSRPGYYIVGGSYAGPVTSQGQSMNITDGNGGWYQTVRDVSETFSSARCFR